jgi:hypothetical protein
MRAISDLNKWSSRGNPVRLIDQKASALESALHDIKKLKATAEKASEHQNGVIETSSSGDLAGMQSASGLGNRIRRRDTNE